MKGYRDTVKVRLLELSAETVVPLLVRVLVNLESKVCFRRAVCEKFLLWGDSVKVRLLELLLSLIHI